jgi:RNA polymerase primary sigma factor
MNELLENTLLIDFDMEKSSNSFARLKELGYKQGFITYEDILLLFPKAEQDVDFLDQIYLAIREAGIYFEEDENLNDALNEDSPDEDDNEANQSSPRLIDGNLLSYIETDNLVGLYFNEAARHPLLTRKEEVDLAKRIESGLQAREEISDINKKSAKRYKELSLLIDDGWTATDNIITSNSRLVISIAKKVMNRGVPFLDLIQEGNIGLMRAVKRFDYERGYKFSTYATWWIRQAVTRALANQSRTIRLPVHISEQLSNVARNKHQLKQQLGRDPGTAEIAEAMGITTEKIHQMSKRTQFPLSLDMPTSVDGDNVLGDFIEDQESPDPFELTSLNLLRQQLDQIFEMLPPREVQILKLRFGLSNGKTHTLREIGIKIGVSRERIRQIEAQAMKRLRHPKIQSKLHSYLSQP